MERIITVVELAAYAPRYKEETLQRMADFFGYHRGLYDGSVSKNDFAASQETMETLERWGSADHALYVIFADAVSVGFVHIGFRGGNVAWIEDIYVDRQHRGRGIASQAIQRAEETIAQNEAYDAVCMDVAPRNAEALRLYHRLGYRNLSMITLRKELYENDRDKDLHLLGLDFKY